MSGRRRRLQTKLKNTEKIERPVILVKREDNIGGARQSAIKNERPQILIKTKTTLEQAVIEKNEKLNSGLQVDIKRNVMIARSETAISSGYTTSPTLETSIQNVQQILEPIAKMTRPTTIITSSGIMNNSLQNTSRKLFYHLNTDFFVVGVIGMQGVGKSTIMNLLANEKADFDYYQKIIRKEDGIFPTRVKTQRPSSRSRTESTHMFITTDRLILLDTPPLLCNAYKKDMTSNELDDLRTVITLMTVCHLLIIVLETPLNMKLFRLIHLAESIKPSQDGKFFDSKYFPNVLFVKNYGDRVDFAPDRIKQWNKLTENMFKNSQLRIYIGQTNDQQKCKRNRSIDIEPALNSFLLPTIKGKCATSYHGSVSNIVSELRRRVLLTPRNSICVPGIVLTEIQWFELLTNLTQKTQNYFLKKYEELHRSHFEMCKESVENWKSVKM